MTLEGDRGWVGVDMRRDPGQLEPGLAALGINLRFRDGRAAPRKGVRLLSWGARSEAGYGPGDILPYGNVAGAGVFNDPIGGGVWLIIATTSGVYKTRPGTTGSQMPLPAGTVIPERVQILQTFSGLVMLRGEDYDPIYCDDLDEGWKTLPVPTGGTRALPASDNGIYFANRLFVIDRSGVSASYRDLVFVSDFGSTLDTLKGDAIYNAFRINQGSRDSLVALYKFNETTLLAFKEDSVYAVSNIYGTNADISANARLDSISTEYGIRSPKAVVQVGNDVWFLAHRRGVCSIRQTEQNKLQGVDVPVSRDIDPLIQRINWQASGNATMAFWDNKVYVAVPLDEADYNNAVLVYDTLTQRWCGHDTAAVVKVFDWLKIPYGGEIRLIYISDDGYVCLYEDGYLDQIPGSLGTWSSASVATTFRSRGYGAGIPGRKRFGEARFRLSTWWPQHSLAAVVEGVAEDRPLVTNQTRSATAYDRPHDATAWDPTNEGDDFHTPYRQDYALNVGANGLELATTGLTGDLHQELEQARQIHRRGRYVQIEVTGSRGRTIVNDLSVECEADERRGPAVV
jgi:hypothetical protein